MSVIRRVVPGEVRSIGEDEVEVILATSDLARDGHVLVVAGVDLSNFRRTPVVLWQHSPSNPVGRCENLQIAADKLTGTVRFAPAGISQTADEVRGLVKSGIVNAVSVGFEPLEMEPLDPKKPRGGQRISTWELLELSFVSVPADPGAVVTARSNGEDAMSDWKIGAKTGLPVEDSDEWDGGAAAESIFTWAGGDDFDVAKARQGFLVYDAEKPKDRASYKLPIARAVDGELKVPKGAVRAAASRLPQTDVPDDIKEKAGKVLDHYREKAGIGDDNRASRGPKMKRIAVRQGKLEINLTRGLYQVAELCCLFHELGWHVDMAKYESSVEGDESKVPAMLAAVFQDLGEALLAMTQEEIAEALANCDIEPEADAADEVLVVEERARIRAAATPGLRAFRRGLAHAKLRSGKTLSADTVRCLRDAAACHDEAMEMHRGALKKHREGMTAVQDMMDRAGVAQEDEDTKAVQTSEGVDDSDGSDNDRAAPDFRRRQAELLALAAA